MTSPQPPAQPPATAHDQNRALFSVFLLPLLVIAADQATKWWILNVVQLHIVGHVPFNALFDLTFVRNFGVSFGQLWADSPLERWGLVALSGIIALIFTIWLTRSHDRLTRLALAFVVGGAVGNMIDRVRFGYVVDFVDLNDAWFGWFPWVFNVADTAINVGAALLILAMFLEPKTAKVEPPASS